MNRKTLGLLSAVAASTALAAAPTGAFGGAHAAAGHAVGLSANRFRPSTLEVKRGDSVTWAWNIHNSEHNVTFHGLHSKTGSHGSFTVRFAHSGTFSYICTVHVAQGMRGKVIVH